MKKVIVLFSMICISLGLTCCRNGKRMCPAMKQELVSFLPQKEKGDSIIFTDNSKKIVFVIDHKNFTKNSYELSCDCKGFLNCPPCECGAQAYLSATSKDKKYGYLVNIMDDNGGVNIETGINGFSVNSSYKNQEVTPIRIDSIYTNYKLGNVIYPKLHVVASDTNYYHSPKTWKVYITPQNEIVGFWDRTSKTLFYKE